MTELSRPTATNISDAGAAIRNGQLVAFPTETVYGLGANALSDQAIAGVFAAKDRPHFNPLIIHVADRTQVEILAEMDGRAQRLAAAFWPGPLTLVLRRAPECPISKLACAGLETVALRCPDHDVARNLLREAAVPIAAPSANPSGHLSPTDARHVQDALGDHVSMILDGGRCPVGLESTIIDLSAETAMILRHGGLAEERISAEIGPLETPDSGTIRAPGQLVRHYAPAHPLRMNAVSATKDEAVLVFGNQDIPTARTIMNLSTTGDLMEAAANLFSMLHDLDRTDCSAIAVMPIPDRGLGRAINDRLARAAEGRA